MGRKGENMIRTLDLLTIWTLCSLSIINASFKKSMNILDTSSIKFTWTIFYAWHLAGHKKNPVVLLPFTSVYECMRNTWILICGLHCGHLLPSPIICIYFLSPPPSHRPTEQEAGVELAGLPGGGAGDRCSCQTVQRGAIPPLSQEAKYLRLLKSSSQLSAFVL